MLKEKGVEWSVLGCQKKSILSVPSRRELLGVSVSKWLAVSCCVCRLGFSLAVGFSVDLIMGGEMTFKMVKRLRAAP